MPGRLALVTPPAEHAARLGAVTELPDDTPRPDAAPGEPLPVLIAAPAPRLVPMRWGMVPSGRVNARGRPVMETIVNARSETVFDKSAYAGTGRGVVPVDAWYEWTGKPRSKTRWRIALTTAEPLLFAAITDTWTAPNGTRVDQVATLTTAPNADLRDIHHRMPVILPDPEAARLWLTAPEAQAKSLLVPLPDGRLTITKSDL